MGSEKKIICRSEFTGDRVLRSGFPGPKSAVEQILLFSAASSVLGVLFLVFLGLPSSLIDVKAAPGELDPSFGNGGIASTSIGSATRDQAKGVAIQSDGKIVVAGSTRTAGGDDTAIVRYKPDGSIDSSFADQGKLILDVKGDSSGDSASAVAIQSDGKIVVAGTAGGDFFVLRLESSGDLDSGFDGDGKYITAIGSDLDIAKALALQPDGKILVCGEVRNPPNSYFGIIRLNSNGALDPSFGTSGKVTTDIGSSLDICFSLSVQQGGGFVAAGSWTSSTAFPPNIDTVVARYTDSGSLDPTFGVGGISKNDIAAGDLDELHSVMTMPDGGVLGGGFTTNNTGRDFMLMKLTPGGSLDSSFGVGGVSITDTSLDTSEVSAIGLSDGKIIAAGSGGTPSSAFTVVRYDPDGSIDSAFGTKGVVVGPEGSLTALAIQPDGRIVATGHFRNSAAGEDDDFRTIRLLGDSAVVSAAVPFDFDGDGRTDPSVFRPSPSAALKGRDPEGSSSQWWIFNSNSQTTRAMAFGQPQDITVPADFTGDGRSDVAFFRPSSSTWYVLRSEDSSYFAFPFGASGDIPAPGDFDGDGKADPAVFRPSSGTWFVLRSSDAGVTIVQFGVNGDKPTVADFDGDGKDDIAIFRPSQSQWWQLRSSEGVKAYAFGSTGDRTVIGDWTGDGRADVAFYRPGSSWWYVLRSEDDSYFAFPWGVPGDIPVPGDYDGDRKTDAAIWRPSNRIWYILGTTSGFEAIPFGSGGDVPLPSSVSVQ